MISSKKLKEVYLLIEEESVSQPTNSYILSLPMAIFLCKYIFC